MASGNWALYDLKLALKWVSAHIHGFGGEKTKITLAGERAGGVLVSMLLLDEETRGIGCVLSLFWPFFIGALFSPHSRSGNIEWQYFLPMGNTGKSRCDCGPPGG